MKPSHPIVIYLCITVYMKLEGIGRGKKKKRVIIAI